MRPLHTHTEAKGSRAQRIAALRSELDRLVAEEEEEEEELEEGHEQAATLASSTSLAPSCASTAETVLDIFSIRGSQQQSPRYKRLDSAGEGCSCTAAAAAATEDSENNDVSGAVCCSCLHPVNPCSLFCLCSPTGDNSTTTASAKDFAAEMKEQTAWQRAWRTFLTLALTTLVESLVGTVVAEYTTTVVR